MQKKLTFPLKFLIFLLILSIVASLFCALANRFGTPSESVEIDPSPAPFTVVIDAGHGGEDGGAVSQSGIFEKEVNLAVAKRLQALLEANGVNVVMTRTTDVLLYDRDIDYHGRKKALDLAARRKITEQTQNAILVSIHMNSYPLSQYHGLQVWYSPNHPHSHEIADTIQANAQALLQPDNHRKTKSATSSIYLLHHLECPAVLVECGFLSNPEEAAALASEEYRNQLAFLLFLSIMQAQNR